LHEYRSTAALAEPIRVVLRRQRNATVLLDEVIGSRYNYFGHADWPSRAPGLKSLDDAPLIRRRALLAFEEAEASGARVEA